MSLQSCSTLLERLMAGFTKECSASDVCSQQFPRPNFYSSRNNVNFNQSVHTLIKYVKERLQIKLHPTQWCSLIKPFLDEKQTLCISIEQTSDAAYPVMKPTIRQFKRNFLIQDLSGPPPPLPARTCNPCPSQNKMSVKQKCRSAYLKIIKKCAVFSLTKSGVVNY